MNNLDVAGILQTYAEKAAKAKNTQHLRNIVREVKQELNTRKIRMDGENEE